MMADKWLKTILAILALLFFLALASPRVWAENRWVVGTDIGFLAYLQ